VNPAAPALAGARPGVNVAPTVMVPSATGVDAGIALAGPGARSFAFLIDWLFRTGLTMVYLLVASLLIFGNLDFEMDPDKETLWYLLGATPASIIYFLYHLILEPLMSGRTPGKRLAGVRVLTPEGTVPTTGALLTRNVFRIVDSMPLLYVVGLLFVFFSKRHVRLGDLAAGTVIAMDRAPFLEKLGSTGDWREVRQRAVSLSRRRGSDVADALAVVDDYKRAAHEVVAARKSPDPKVMQSAEYLDAVYSDLHDTIHRPARRAHLVLLSLMRDRVPAAMYAMRMHVLAVTLLFITSAVTGAWLVFTYPDLIAMFADPKLIATVERGELWTDGVLNVTPSAVMSMELLTNNIVVSFFAFCSGIIFGLGTFYLMGLNGLSLGAFFAFTGQHELAGRLFDFVVAHGCVELSCICIAGAAGSYLGEALIRPGAQSRSEAFRAAAGEGIRVLAVVTLLLVICGFIEGYVSPDPEVPRWARVTIGVGYWLFMVSLLRGYVFGRSRGGARLAV
jgi:uncharacterized membrane protein SpoIIM required for sporulation/uncharacterized RDD family membrane protein YckC